MTPAEGDLSRVSRNTVFLTRWAREIDDDNDWAMQLSYVDPYRVTGPYALNVATFDLDFQYHVTRGSHDVVWGFGYRNNSEKVFFTPMVGRYNSEQIPSYSVQDTLTLVDDRLFATFGSKFDNNSITHFEYQPTARLAWTPDERTSIWGAISRAVRLPMPARPICRGAGSSIGGSARLRGWFAPAAQ